MSIQLLFIIITNHKLFQKITTMQDNSQIFLNNQEGPQNGSTQQIKYIHNTESQDFINQFFWDEGSHQLSKLNHESAPVLLEQIQQSNPQNGQKLQNPKKKGKRQKSLFHNFQKHLVITLKKIVRVKSKPQDGIIPKIAEEMWQIFLKSHLYTKTILHILYGAEQQQQECAFTSSMLNRFGYVDLFNKYSQDLVKQAQNYLRHETVKAVKRVNIRQYLSKRRLSKAQQFEEYLAQFIEQLSEGPIKRRIPKDKKKVLKAYQKNLNKKISQQNRQKASNNFDQNNFNQQSLVEN